MTGTRELATTYFTAWKNKDFDTLRSILADDATFSGPMGTAGDADECVAGLRGMAEQVMTDLDVLVMVVDGDDVITWYELHSAKAAPAPTANWMHVENGRIAAIRATFDPRPLVS